MRTNEWTPNQQSSVPLNSSRVRERMAELGGVEAEQIARRLKVLPGYVERLLRAGECAPTFRVKLARYLQVEEATIS